MKRDSEISKEFYESLCDFVIPQCNIWTFDAWNLAEYTIIYCLERKKDIPLLNENFFGDCLRYVSGGMMMKGEIENELLKSVIKKFDKFEIRKYDAALFSSVKLNKKGYKERLQDTAQREISRVVLVVINMKNFTMMNFRKYRVPYFKKDL